MKNKIFFLLIFIFFATLTKTNADNTDFFDFKATEIEIIDDGNRIISKKRGEILTGEGITIKANEFDYKKDINILEARGKVQIFDPINNYILNAKKIIYFKNDEIYDAYGEVKIIIKSRFELNSERLSYNKKEDFINSKEKSFIKDNAENNYYELEKFNFFIKDEVLKGNKIIAKSNYNLPNSDTYFFKSGILDLKNNKFVAQDPQIFMHKNIFGNQDNDPRLYGKISTIQNDITKINIGSFTSCKKTDKCPPWQIEAEEIIHDQKKKQLKYKNAKLKVYNIPILYLPKFFHPDPSVERQSGFLKPETNDSNILGSSYSIPYFHVISSNKDFTFKPTIFKKDMQMFQNEYRQENQYSSFITDFGIVKNFKSSLLNKKKDFSHLFLKFNKNLNLENFAKSDLNVKIENTNDDNYLKIFDSNLSKNDISPNNVNVLNSSVNLDLKSNEYNLSSGFSSYKKLSESNNDKYEYVLPYYEFNKSLINTKNNYNVDLSSTGSNVLKDTNNLQTKIINNINISSKDYFTDLGLKNNLNLYIKNLNTSAKNDILYKSSLQSELVSLLDLSTSLPLIKFNNKDVQYLIPKFSFKYNPSDMKNYNQTSRFINTDNIFNYNRLGLDDTYEEGKSLTYGISYKNEKKEDPNKFYELSLASSLRDKEVEFIPSYGSINKKSSNIFGSFTNNNSEYLKLKYEFALDNNYDKFEFNSLNLTLELDNFMSNIDFIEENGSMGSSNSIGSNLSYIINDENLISFNTRRNREIDLTEFYDLVYEYKNDCLVAAVKYNKKFYQDRELKPSENLFFTITLFPLTTYEKKIDR